MYLPQANTLIMQIDIIYVACSVLYGTKSNSKFKTKDFIEIQLGLYSSYNVRRKIFISDFNKFWSNTKYKVKNIIFEIWSCYIRTVVNCNYYIYTNTQFACQVI